MEELDIEGITTYLHADASAIRLMAGEMAELQDNNNADRLHAIAIVVDHQLHFIKQLTEKVKDL